MKQDDIDKATALFVGEVNKFKQWALSWSNKAGGWETEYFFWSDIYPSVRFVLEIPTACWNETLLKELLYILARDNEVEVILDMLIANLTVLLYVVEHCGNYDDPEARWQLAAGLGRIKEKVTMQLSRYIEDSDEYVQRRAKRAQIADG